MNKFAIVGDSGIRYTHNNGNIAVDPQLATASFLSALDKMQPMIERYEKESAKLTEDIPVLQDLQKSAWRKEDELKALKADLDTLDRKIQLSLKPIDKSDAPQEEQEQQPELATHDSTQQPRASPPTKPHSLSNTLLNLSLAKEA